MTLDQFISINNLQPADALVVKKEPFRLLDHYIIYLGKDWNRHIFIANYTKGTRIIPDHELAEFSAQFSPHRIVRFQGNSLQRNAAVNRALGRKDQTSYHLILNNCEHYSNYVQKGVSESNQTQTFGKSLVMAGLITAGSTKKQEIQAAGILAATFGLLTLLFDQE
jgi:hypothetical protein